MMHGRPIGEDDAPAGMTAVEVAGVVSTLPQLPGMNEPPTQDKVQSAAWPSNVVRVDFQRGMAA